jgi:D-3-phosphoglycerate dehydrogenase / 2-oxoglutarate reductase
MPSRGSQRASLGRHRSVGRIRFSSVLGEAGVNIATFHVGREAPGANAVALIEVDDVPSDVLTAVQALPQVQQAKPLRF